MDFTLKMAGSLENPYIHTDFQPMMGDQDFNKNLFSADDSPVVEYPPELSSLVGQIQKLPERHRWWLRGFLYGQQTSAHPTAPHLSESRTEGNLVILYGSQTGNAKSLAEDFKRRWTQLNVVVHNMTRYKPLRLKKEDRLLLIISTHGEGDPPDQALAFYQKLLNEDRMNLEQLQYAVIGLGDRSYAHFCKPAREIDEKLMALGASPLRERLDCDVDFKSEIAQWEKTFLSRLAPSAPVDTQPPLASTGASDATIESAELVERVNLCLDQADKKVWHIELQSDLDYRCGDSLGVVLSNDDKIVERAMRTIADFDPSSRYSFNGADEVELSDILRNRAELHRLTQAQITHFHKTQPSPQLEEVVVDEQTLEAFVGRHNVPDLLSFAEVKPGAEDVVSLLRPITHRLYSISSSPQAQPGEIHLTVREQTYGLASPRLAILDLGIELPVFIKSNPSFRLPEDSSKDIILIGAGTGVAPYRSFLFEKLEQKNQGAPVGRSWVFLGEQSFYTSFLYQLDWQYLMEEGVLDHLSVAFSRDGAKKVYVHHRLIEKATQIYRWICQGAHVYVCGDRKRMAVDVHQALETIHQVATNSTAEEAQTFWAELAADGRYQRDVY